MSFMYWSLHGEDANKAIRAVKNKLGDNYQYFANSAHWEIADQLKVTVVVIGYNSHEFKKVTVRWKEADSDVAQ